MPREDYTGTNASEMEPHGGQIQARSAGHMFAEDLDTGRREEWWSTSLRSSTAH